MLKNLAALYIAELDALLRQIVDSIKDEPDFGLMIRYAMGWVDEHNQPYQQSTGKRLRPVFLLLCNEAAGGDWRQSLPAAASVELLHNFSLIHDDIQDDSLTRHGRPTVWQIWGIANAINAGDAMFALAYTAMAKLEDYQVKPDQLLRVWNIFNRANLELTRGQHLDMRFERHNDVQIPDYISMIRGKSAALLAACAEIGALLATGNPETAEQYARFGLNLGIAFQIRDDILGIWGNPSVTGKSTATDIVSRKKSLPVLYGLSRSRELAELYRRDGFSDLDVKQSLEILDRLDAHNYAREEEQKYQQYAIQVLDDIRSDNPSFNRLIEFIDLLFQRTR